MATFLDLLKSKNTNNNLKEVGRNKIEEASIQNILADLDTGRSSDTFKIPQSDGSIKEIPYTYKTTDPITVKCERSLDAKRLKLFFSAKPSKETLQQLKDQDFKWDNDGVYWHAKDCLVNRMFLAATFDLPDLMQDVYNDDPSVKTGINSYATYKDQVKDLLEELKLDCADLMIVAVDCLYNQTFKGGVN